MKKIKAISLLLATITCVSLAFSACKKESNKVYPEIPKAEMIAPSGKDFISNGKTDYKIVVSEDAKMVDITAAGELTEFVYQATGVQLETITDAGLTFDGADKYISLGNTTLYEGSGVEMSFDEFRESGYVMKLFDNTLICAGTDCIGTMGTLYAVYDFMKYGFGFEVYAADEIYYEKKDTVPMLQYDEKCIPSIPLRHVKMKLTTDDATLEQRLRLNNMDLWASFTHTVITKYLKQEKYPGRNEFYGTTGGVQLCFTSQAARDAIVEEVKKDLSGMPNTTKVMLGMEDTSTMCGCDNCVSKRNLYGDTNGDGVDDGGGDGGVQLEFTNYVARAVDEWLVEAYPNRNVEYFFFAYITSLQAPAKYDETVGKYVLTNTAIEPYENVGVLIAPISMDFSKPFDDAANSTYRNILQGWSDVFHGRNITIWNYSLNAYSYMYNFNNFGVIKDYYEVYEDFGTTFIYEQGQYDSRISCFEELRAYTEAKLMWNTELDYNELVKDFMDHYFGEASPEMLNYFNFIRSYLKYLEETKGANGKVFYSLDKKEFWPVSMVNNSLDLLDKCFEKIQPLKESDPARYTQLYNRIQKERISPLYMMLSFYRQQITQEEKEAYLSDFEKYTSMYNITQTRESSIDLKGLIEQWKLS